MKRELDRLLREAIQERRMIRFTLDGLERVGEPHDYGALKEVARVLVWQVGGGSRSGGLPDWRLVTVDKISRLEVLEQKFDGPREASAGHRHHWDRLFASVSHQAGG